MPGYLNIFYETYPQSPGVEIQRALFLVLFLLMTMELIVVPFFPCFMYIVVLSNVVCNQNEGKQTVVYQDDTGLHDMMKDSRLLNKP